jgi:hypothetical protein
VGGKKRDSMGNLIVGAKPTQPQPISITPITTKPTVTYLKRFTESNAPALIDGSCIESVAEVDRIMPSEPTSTAW